MSLPAFALIATPLLAFLGLLVGHGTSRRGAVELDRWRKREETMRLLRWGTEIALARDVVRGPLGLEVPDALLEASILDEDRALVSAIATALARHVILDEEEAQPP